MITADTAPTIAARLAEVDAELATLRADRTRRMINVTPTAEKHRAVGVRERRGAGGETGVVGPPAASRKNQGKTCTICRSPKRVTIDAALAAGGTVRAVGAAHGFSSSAIYRHSTKCLPMKIARAAAEREDKVTAATLLDAMVALLRTTQGQLDLAVAAKMGPTDVAKLTREVRENVALMGRFVGAFVGESAKTVDNRVQVLALREMSVGELRALTDALRSRPK